MAVEDMARQYSSDLKDWCLETIKTGSSAGPLPPDGDLIEAFGADRDNKVQSIAHFEERLRKEMPKMRQDAVDVESSIDRFVDAESSQAVSLHDFRMDCLRAFQDTCGKAIEARSSAAVDRAQLIVFDS